MKCVWLSIESISNNVTSDHGGVSCDDDPDADDGAAAEAPGAAAEAGGAGFGCAADFPAAPVLAALGRLGLWSTIAIAMPSGDIHTPSCENGLE